jgi:hypothetical protein
MFANILRYGPTSSLRKQLKYSNSICGGRSTTSTVVVAQPAAVSHHHAGKGNGQEASEKDKHNECVDQRLDVSLFSVFGKMHQKRALFLLF